MSLEDAHAALSRIESGTEVTAADIRTLAQSLLDIAEIAMPDTYFATDMRCQLARAVLAALPSATEEPS
jgi:hypothetical protein